MGRIAERTRRRTKDCGAFFVSLRFYSAAAEEEPTAEEVPAVEEVPPAELLLSPLQAAMVNAMAKTISAAITFFILSFSFFFDLIRRGCPFRQRMHGPLTEVRIRKISFLFSPPLYRY